jgi:hypothetical protein
MTIEKTFEWLFKRMQNPTIKPCAFDIECLTFLAEWVNREKQKSIRENELFAKLYCHVFIQEIQFYKDFEFAQKSMNDILRLPIERHYDLFTQRLNEFELNRYFISLGIDIEKRKFDEDGISIHFDNDKLKKAEKEAFVNFASGKWDKDKVYKSLNNQITESLNRFK